VSDKRGHGTAFIERHPRLAVPLADHSDSMSCTSELNPRFHLKGWQVLLAPCLSGPSERVILALPTGR
jgi:hypothetical protein